MPSKAIAKIGLTIYTLKENALHGDMSRFAIYNSETECVMARNGSWIKDVTKAWTSDYDEVFGEIEKMSNPKYKLARFDFASIGEN